MSQAPLPVIVADRVVPRVDGWRLPSVGSVLAFLHQEWMHFCVALPGSPGGRLLLNVSFAKRVREGAITFFPRLILLAEQDEQWTGSVVSDPAMSPPRTASRLDVAIGKNRLAWRSGAFHFSLKDPVCEAELALTPLVFPTIPTNVSLGPGRSIHWVAVPRLAVHGWVILRGKRIALEGALAYHDHNWGGFEWGADLHWEWGFMHPHQASNPWSVVVARVSDGAGGRTLARMALVWKGQNLVRIFQNHELGFAFSGRHTAARPFTLPPVAQLLLPDLSAEVPARCRIDAAGVGDCLEAEFETKSRSRIALPSDVHPFGLVVLNEVAGNARVRGSVGGERFELQGPAMMEFARG